MEKKNIDWANLGFGYRVTDVRYVSNYRNDAWDEGVLTEDATIQLNECAGILQYCQEIFEGLKAYTTEDGRIVTFRPECRTYGRQCKTSGNAPFPQGKISGCHR